MSFVDADDVIAVAEEVLAALWALIGYELPQPDPADELCRRHAPIRLGQAGSALRTRTRRVHRLLRRHPVPGVPGALRRRGGDARRRLPAAPDPGRLAGVGQAARTPRAWPTCSSARTAPWSGPVAKNLSDAERDGLAAHVGAKPGDCVFFSAGPAKASRALLGAARGEIARRLDMIDAGAWAFVWIVDPPLFEPAGDATAAGDVAVGSGAWTAVHHAFTAPKPRIRVRHRHRSGRGARRRLRHRVQRP